MVVRGTEDHDESSVARFDLIRTDFLSAQVGYAATKEAFLAAVAQVAPRLSFLTVGEVRHWTLDGYNSDHLYLRVPEMDISLGYPATIDERFDLSFRPWGVVLGVSTQSPASYELYRLLVVLLDGQLPRAR